MNTDKSHTIELLAPAKDATYGIAAVNCGADAVYVGAPRFGARAQASNGLADIARLVRHAHLYRAKVYVALNTILTDAEIDEAAGIAHEVWNAGADGLIIQDMGLLECGLPPIPLIASTQCDITTPEKALFLEKVGFARVILARELSLDVIRGIRAATAIELEAFIHGALCVSYSGRCYMSYAIGGRSGNRGECAQPCRKTYSLVDEKGTIVVEKAHLLSLRDMDRSGAIEEMIDAGITSFKIEGRLKDEAYIKTVVTHYRTVIDGAMERKSRTAASDGYVNNPFNAAPSKVFNRGFTEYFLRDKNERTSSRDTPKWKGEKFGKVATTGKGFFTLEHATDMIPGDGISFFSRDNELAGTRIEKIDLGRIHPTRMQGLNPGTIIYRNYDKRYHDMLERWTPKKVIPVMMEFSYTHGLVSLTVADGHGNTGVSRLEKTYESAEKKNNAMTSISKQLSKLADTEFVAAEVDIVFSDTPPFVPLAELNALRREAVEKLREKREHTRVRVELHIEPNDAPYPEREIFYESNVLNEYAKRFYERHGAEVREYAAESGLDMGGRRVMTTKHCIRREYDLCGKETGRAFFLVDDRGKRYPVKFDCENCLMEIYF